MGILLKQMMLRYVVELVNFICSLCVPVILAPVP